MITNRDRVNEIYEAILPEMKKKNIPDTTENRLAFLRGVRDAWREDPMHSLDKIKYMIAIDLEIAQLAIRNMTNRTS